MRLVTPSAWYTHTCVQHSCSPTTVHISSPLLLLYPRSTLGLPIDVHTRKSHHSKGVMHTLELELGRIDSCAGRAVIYKFANGTQFFQVYLPVYNWSAHHDAQKMLPFTELEPYTAIYHHVSNTPLSLITDAQSRSLSIRSTVQPLLSFGLAYEPYFGAEIWYFTFRLTSFSLVAQLTLPLLPCTPPCNPCLRNRTG